MALTDIKSRVISILAKHPDARDSDDILYYYVAESMSSGITALSLQNFLCNRKKLGIPGFETVRRTRQKAQEQHPELKASTDTLMKRKEAEEDYVEFARHG